MAIKEGDRVRWKFINDGNMGFSEAYETHLAWFPKLENDKIYTVVELFTSTAGYGQAYVLDTGAPDGNMAYEDEVELVEE